MLWIERIISIAAGLLLIYPEKFSDWAGLVIFIVMFVIQYVTQHKGSDDNHNSKTSVTA